MKRTTYLLSGTLIVASLLLSSCANTDTPTSRAIAAGLHQQAAVRSAGALGAPQRTGMQEFFARGGAQ